MKYLRHITYEHDKESVANCYYQFNSSGEPLRSLEIYEDGTVLKYNTDFLFDDDGGLPHISFDDWYLESDEELKVISENEFNEAWTEYPASNNDL